MFSVFFFLIFIGWGPVTGGVPIMLGLKALRVTGTLCATPHQ